MKKKTREERGITLIALVVTIIVLLILAGVAISLTIGNNGIFSRAGNAANMWKKAEANEQEEMSDFESLYDETVKNLGLGGSNDTIKKDIDKIDGTETKNIETTDKNGERVVVPAGFIVDENANTVAGGLVIIDKNGNNSETVGNEFVWIPCTIDGANGSIKYDRYAFTRESPTWDCRQSLVLGENGEYEKDADESYKIQRVDNTSYYYHEAMPEEERVSIEKYGGYYIGRYEVGCDVERTSHKEITAAGKIKPGLNVYKYVTRDEAATIAERMYSGKSRLCSSYAWDTALKFIDGETGTYAVNSEGDNYSGKLENTGYHAEKNIYDMGGNIAEWTTESTTNTHDPCTYRAGFCEDAVLVSPAGDRGTSNPLGSNDRVGFRCALYM